MSPAPANQPSTQPTVAVIIPAYNCEPYILAALQSIGQQTRLPERVVVIDDGSTDATAAVVEAFAEQSPFPLTLLRQENRGIAGARNAGMAACHEDLVAFLDGDDTYYPPFLDRAAAALAQHPDLLLCFLDRDVVDAGGRFLRRDLDHPVFRAIAAERLADGVSVLTGNPFLALMPGNVIPIGLMVRRTAFDAIGGFDEEMRLVEDKPFLMRLARLGPFGFLDEPLGIWRRHTSNASGSSNAFRMAYYDDLALAKLERDKLRLQLSEAEMRAMHEQRKRNARHVLYAASNEGRAEFPGLAWSMLRERRAPLGEMAKSFGRYAWRRLTRKRHGLAPSR